MLRPADVARLNPDDFEYLWRSILRKENGATYRRLDGLGVDCMTGRTAYQFYSHQGTPWAGVQRKFREDLAAVQAARAAGSLHADRWVFITTFPFKEPDQATWLAKQKVEALPLIVENWGDEAVLATPQRQEAIERMIGIIQQVANVTVQVANAGIVAIGGNAPGIHIAHGGVAIHNAPPRKALVGVPYQFGERVRMLAWDGDLDHLRVEDPRDVTGDELSTIHCSICRYQSDPQQPVWARVEGAQFRVVWEVDQEGQSRRKLRSAYMKQAISFLSVAPRSEPSCLAFCARCGKTSGGGQNCAECSTAVGTLVVLKYCH